MVISRSELDTLNDFGNTGPFAVVSTGVTTLINGLLRRKLFLGLFKPLSFLDTRIAYTL